jgi:hypothetical protein
MAFPTSSLTNNQVHKIGNRRWVYDSTLGVWDKVAANDTNISDQTGTLGGVTFPTGMVLKEQAFDEVATITAGSTTWSSGNTVSFTKLKASADSYLVYIWNGHIDRYPNSGSFIDVRMGYTPSGGSIAYTTERQYDRDYNIGGPRILDPMCFQQYFSSFNAGTHTFVMQCRWGGGTNNNSQLVTDTDHYVFIKEVSK